uniref:Uncharacterized protein n=1 Tax=Rhizophora mucronata TaxID=61149 RepID=A0A2P2MSS9_RHIMU
MDMPFLLYDCSSCCIFLFKRFILTKISSLDEGFACSSKKRMKSTLISGSLALCECLTHNSIVRDSTQTFQTR